MLGGIDPLALHIALNAGCALLVMSVAWQAHGDLLKRLGDTLSMTALIYGLFALAILAFRLYFSRPTFFMSLGATLTCGCVLVWVRSRRTGLKIGIVAGEPLEARDWKFAQVVQTADADLSRFDVLLVPFQGTLSRDWLGALSRAAIKGVQIRHIAEYLQHVRGQTAVEHFKIEDLDLSRIGRYIAFKRIFDILVLLFFFPIITGTLVIASVAILFTMGWPVLYLQKRVGRGGIPFTMVKLRTMRKASPTAVQMATSKSDPRITRLGKFLRRYRIDELPQFWNIIRGDMSLIGPRPEQLQLTQQYIKEIPAFAYRSLVPPGITGWAQVRAGYAANLDESREKLTYDLYYVQNFSAAIDAQIILRTFWTLAAGSGVR